MDGILGSIDDLWRYHASVYERMNEEMKRVKITLKDGTIFEYEDQYYWGFDLDDRLRKGEQFLQTNNAIIRIDSIYHVTWETVNEEETE